VLEADRLSSPSSYSSPSSSTLSFSPSAPRNTQTTKTTTSPIMSTRPMMTTPPPQVTTTTSQSHPRQRPTPPRHRHPRQLDIPLLHLRPTPRAYQPEPLHRSHPLGPLGPMQHSMKLKMTMGTRPKRRVKRFTFPACPMSFYVSCVPFFGCSGWWAQFFPPGLCICIAKRGLS